MDGKELSQVELLVEIVGEKINAQVAAHERYSQAFIRILDALETIIDSQDNISGGDTAYFKQLASDISEFNEKIKDQEAEDKVWRTNFFNKLDNHISNHDSKITDLQELIESFQISLPLLVTHFPLQVIGFKISPESQFLKRTEDNSSVNEAIPKSAKLHTFFRSCDFASEQS